MLTNYFRSFRVAKLAALLFIFFLLPVQSNAALPAETGIFQTATVESGVSESDAETTTVEKKKDKIQIIRTSM